MACINMFSPEHHHQGGGGGGGGVPMSPRISFSNDFVVASSSSSSAEPSKHDNRAKAMAPPDPNFEFTSAGHAPFHPMMAADELFFKGRLVPLRQPIPRSPNTTTTTTTLRDELLRGGHDSDQADEVAMRASKGPSSIRWKGLLGLKRGSGGHGHCSSKKQEEVVVVASSTQELRSAADGGARIEEDDEFGF